MLFPMFVITPVTLRTSNKLRNTEQLTRLVAIDARDNTEPIIPLTNNSSDTISSTFHRKRLVDLNIVLNSFSCHTATITNCCHILNSSWWSCDTLMRDISLKKFYLNISFESFCLSFSFTSSNCPFLHTHPTQHFTQITLLLSCSSLSLSVLHSHKI